MLGSCQPRQLLVITNDILQSDSKCLHLEMFAVCLCTANEWSKCSKLYSVHKKWTGGISVDVHPFVTHGMTKKRIFNTLQLVEDNNRLHNLDDTPRAEY